MRYIIYCRKSQEAEDRQALSLEGQLTAIRKYAAGLNEVEIIDIVEEARSAKKPGRPAFARVLIDIQQGRADGIIAWHPDRLSRNSVDGGEIIYLLDQGKLKDLRFCTYSFENNPQGKFMLGIMFSNSKYYSDSLSVNVKRGMTLKLEKGWKPGLAPIGYKNCRNSGTIVPDTQHFKAVRQMFDLMLSGAHTPSSIHRIVCNEWRYRTPKRKSLGGSKPALSTIYKILTNPFYAGHIRWKGQLHPGKHKPVVHNDEFARVQTFLGSPLPAPSKNTRFTYAGLFRCGSCGLAVTAERKRKPSGREYTYYHCTRVHRTPRCTEPSVEERVLEAQIADFLDRVTIHKPIYDWLVESLEGSSVDVAAKQADLVKQDQKEVTSLEAQMNSLLDMRQNNYVTDDQFLERREKLQIELGAAQERLHKHQEAALTFEPAQIISFFLCNTKKCFELAPPEAKRKLIKILCSNPSLMDKKPLLTLKKPFEEVAEIAEFRRRCGFVKDIRTATSHQKSPTMRRFRQLIADCNTEKMQTLCYEIRHYLRQYHPALLCEFQAVQSSQSYKDTTQGGSKPLRELRMV